MRRNKNERREETLVILIVLILAALVIMLICYRESETPKREDFVPVMRTICAGDTAWELADEYCPDTLDKREYLGWVAQENGRDVGSIKAGETLIFLQVQ